MKFLFKMTLLAVLMISGVAEAKKLKAGEAFPSEGLNGLKVFAEGRGPGAQKGSWSVEKTKGKVVLVDFWASWCGPCKDALPAYDKLYKKYAKQGLVVVGVNVDDELKSGQDFLKEHPVAFPHVFDQGKKLVSSVGVETMPTSFLVGRDGKVSEVHLGFRTGDAKKMDDKIARLLKSK